MMLPWMARQSLLPACTYIYLHGGRHAGPLPGNCSGPVLAPVFLPHSSAWSCLNSTAAAASPSSSSSTNGPNPSPRPCRCCCCCCGVLLQDAHVLPDAGGWVGVTEADTGCSGHACCPVWVGGQGAVAPTPPPCLPAYVWAGSRRAYSQGPADAPAVLPGWPASTECGHSSKPCKIIIVVMHGGPIRHPGLGSTSHARTSMQGASSKCLRHTLLMCFGTGTTTQTNRHEQLLRLHPSYLSYCCSSRSIPTSSCGATALHRRFPWLLPVESTVRAS